MMQHSPGVMMPALRSSIVSQNSSSGRAETSLIAEEVHGLNGGDSGQRTVLEHIVMTWHYLLMLIFLEMFRWCDNAIARGTAP